MATTTQYNPNRDLNERLLAVGASKTVYALVTPQMEAIKATVFGDSGETRREDYMDRFREAWTGKQDAYHEEFFDVWHEWSKPVIKLDRARFPFYYPTAGASEPIRQIIFDHAANAWNPTDIMVFEGEYEGYKAMAEAAGLGCIEVHRDDWKDAASDEWGVWRNGRDHDALFFISAPSAIDGNVWEHFNAFLASMPENSVVVDVTYVGAIGKGHERFNLNQKSVKAVVFSLSKPFGAYYDRIGGVFMREESLALFGNRWFKGLTGLAIGTRLMQLNDVFAMHRLYSPLQAIKTAEVGNALDIPLVPSDVFILANGPSPEAYGEVGEYLARANTIRLCLTPGMDADIRAEREKFKG